MHAVFARGWRKAVLGLVAAGLSASAWAQAPEPLRVRLDWTPWGVHGAFHLAQQKGWYKQAGLDVSLEDGNGSVTTVQIVGAGDSFDVGHAALASMMIAREKGMPVKAVAVFARQSDIGLLVPADAGITGPAQLKGKKVAYTAGSLEAPFIDAFLAAGKLKKGDLELINVDAAGKASTYAVGRADAAFSTIPFFLPVVSQNRPSRAVRFADFGLNMPSFGLFANESKLAQRSEAIARFAGVTARAWEYIYAGHQDEAVAAILAQRPQARLDKKVLRGQIDALQPYFGQPAPGARLGAIVPQDWTQAVKTLSSVGLVGAGAEPTSFYVPDLAHAETYDTLVQP
ncbi:ABC transporter substrate-binding protein [Achromobacter sp. Bel]|uniref:ABC transporter substrate-binding protein n=1 Tax=Achromobacter sp. Bel TaxID=2727415 RepID=UPI00145CCD59|nr:ABC transporter substrate-binding protein [Achromobacter sp. Bel]NMK47898.1 ABC transporter substrate-binding protein [Achromobacter sp. Bel]